MPTMKQTVILAKVVSDRDARLLVLTQPHTLSDAQRLDVHMLIARAVNIPVDEPLTAGGGTRRCNESKANVVKRK